ncbi:MAG: flagellar hook-associated protein FlgK [Epsilonproteobacteria bacterium]|nr:MAG: flagellar hook-associated protein FlgK [Campylobacterota bacterium]RLA67523.1 MAG: flagellar hook-associated protein FlgK [Campylobacterota bacterium]
MADLLSIAKSGLFVAKKGMETTSHNIANANTEGFSRQRVNITTNRPIVKGGLIEGTGAQISGIRRIHDPFIMQKLGTDLGNAKYFDEMSNSLAQIEGIFGDPDSEGITTVLNRFFNSFSELAGNPEDESIRSYVRDNALRVISDFNRLGGSMDGATNSINSGIQIGITDINSLADQIAKLNRKILIMESSTGDEASDLRDTRDLSLSKLAEIVNINFYQDNQGMYVVNIDGAGTLVAGAIRTEIMARPNRETGQFEIYYQKRPSIPITNKITKGSLGALVQTRDGGLNKLKEALNTIAFEVVGRVNQIHQKGYARRELKTDEKGNPTDVDKKGITSNIPFFKKLSDNKRAVFNITLSDEVNSDLSNIVTGLLPNRPGDNRVALAISKIPHEKLLNDGQTTLEEEYLKAIGNIGIAAGRANFEKEQSDGILAHTKAMKENMSGVSIDEEATQLMRYQSAFQASAKVIKEADEMMDVVLNIMP